MNMWRFTTNWAGPFNILVYAGPQDFPSRQLLTDGQPKTWAIRPKFAPFQEKGKKTQKPLGDISTLSPGSLVLNAKAYDALHEYLARFGQLLEAEGDGAPYYFYNVTDIVPCFDMTQSTVNAAGGITKEVFDPVAAPKGDRIFKEPRRVRSHIYMTDDAKNAVEQIIMREGLTGATFELVA